MGNTARGGWNKKRRGDDQKEGGVYTQSLFAKQAYSVSLQ